MKNYLLVLLLSVSSISGIAQIRHVPGVRSIDAAYGITGNGQLISGSFVSYWKPNLYMKATGFFESGKENGITYQSFGADFKVARTLLKKSPVFYFNAVGGVMVSVDKPMQGAELFNVSQTLKYGAVLGVESELFISDKFVFVLGWDQRILIGSTFGNYRWFASGGIRFNF